MPNFKTITQNLKLINHKSQFGLTLIELVISVAIVGLLALVGAIAVSKVKNTQALKTETFRLATALKRAHSLSQAPLANTDFKEFKSYGVSIDNSNQAYSLEARKNQDGTGDKKSIEVFKLDNRVNFDTISLGGESGIYFGVEENGELTNLIGVSNPKLTLIKGGESKQIKISNPYGVIEIE